jgi:DNA adenine methylase
MTRAGPLLKYPGGKAKLLHEILPRLPERMATYYEPFVGGGAVFFALAHEQRFARAVISDRNPNIVGLYCAVRDDPRFLMAVLDEHHAKHSEDYYYEVRAAEDALPLFSAKADPVALAGRTLYLNKATFNGLYRTSRVGDFNASFGKVPREKLKLYDRANVLACSELFRNVEIRCGDFEVGLRGAKKGDAAFCDPPYLYPPGATNFVAYDGHPFHRADHERLVVVSTKLAAKGVFVMISNDDNAAVRSTYGTLDLVPVMCPRAINRDADKRGPVPELLAIATR